MNEKAINKVIGDYAVENANLRIRVAELETELETLNESTKGKEEKGEVK